MINYYYLKELDFNSSTNGTSTSKVSLDGIFFHINQDTSLGVLSAAPVAIIITTSISNLSSNFLAILSDLDPLSSVAGHEVLAIRIRIIIQSNDIVGLDVIVRFVTNSSEISEIFASTEILAFSLGGIGVVVRAVFAAWGV